jgi:ABC-type enterochelin transport system permease subunit
MNRIVAIIVSVVIVFGAGVVTENVTHRTAPICIVVNSDGNPAPSSCTNPNAYQVNK